MSFDLSHQAALEYAGIGEPPEVEYKLYGPCQHDQHDRCAVRFPDYPACNCACHVKPASGWKCPQCNAIWGPAVMYCCDCSPRGEA